MLAITPALLLLLQVDFADRIVVTSDGLNVCDIRGTFSSAYLELQSEHVPLNLKVKLRVFEVRTGRWSVRMSLSSRTMASESWSFQASSCELVVRRAALKLSFVMDSKPRDKPRRGAMVASLCRKEITTVDPATKLDTETPANQIAARAHFREGKQRFLEKCYVAAAAAFSRSLAAKWSIEAAYNRALSLDRANLPVAALQAYRAYLAHYDYPLSSARLGALDRSERLRQKISELLLRIDSAEKIREIRINGAPVAQGAFPWLTLPGAMEIEFVGETPGQLRRVHYDARPGSSTTIVFAGFDLPAKGSR